MGQTITSAVDMVSYAGALRRAARQVTTPEVAEKIQRSAVDLEKTAIAKVVQAGPRIGTLLDTLV
jgi:hypothetical protein